MYADDAGIAPGSQDGLTRMITVILVARQEV